MKVSFIIPVYNAEKSIGRCIDSILNQTHKELEIIIVNDGSTDNSAKICNEYSIKYENIIYVSQVNKGVSKTRNLALTLATGEYIQFIDADDYIDREMTEILIRETESKKFDIVICGYKNLNSTGQIIDEHRLLKEKCNKDEFFCKFKEMFEKNICNPLWNKLIRKKYIDINNIRFNENLSIGEDLLFNLEVISYCKNIKIIEECFYNYINNTSDSLSTLKRKNPLQTQKLIYKEIDYIFDKNGINSEFLNKYLCSSFVKDVIYFYISNYNIYSYKEKIDNFKMIFKDPYFNNKIEKCDYKSIKEKIFLRVIKLKNAYVTLLFIFIYKKMNTFITNYVNNKGGIKSVN